MVKYISIIVVLICLVLPFFFWGDNKEQFTPCVYKCVFNRIIIRFRMDFFDQRVRKACNVKMDANG